MEITRKTDERMIREGTCIERRGKPRLMCALPAIVRGTDSNGTKFQTAGTVENLSATGLFLRLERPVEQGCRLCVIFCFAAAAPNEGTGPNIAVHGIVLRSELAENSNCRAAIQLQHYRFL